MKTLLIALFLSNAAQASAPHEQALLMALDDEYKAKATYEQVIEDFGAIRPFTNIKRSEEKHIEALIPLLNKYGVAIPDNPYLGNIASFNSIKEACLGGVQAEVDNVALYDKIEAMVDQEDILNVFDRLRWASQERHLPAFQRCARRN